MRGHIAVITTDQHVDPMGTYITHRNREVRGNLTLNVEVPLQHITSMRICFDRGGAQLAGRETARKHILPLSEKLSRQLGIGGTSGGFRSKACRSILAGKYHERRGLVFLQEEVTWQRQ